MKIVKKYKENYEIIKYKIGGLTVFRKKKPYSPQEPDRNRLSVNEMFLIKHRNLHPLNISETIDKKAGRRLNVVADTINETYLLGGVGTALILATVFCARENIDLRIITRCTDVSPDSYFKFIKMMNLPQPDKIEFYSDYQRDAFGISNQYLSVTREDTFLATSWWTAQELKNSGINKFYYIIQEVETFFYPQGSLHWRCSQILNDPDIRFIVNSKYLYDYFKEHFPNIVENGVYFVPAFPNEIYRHSDKSRSKHKLFFYSRPYNERNLYELGVLALDEAIRNGFIDTDKWEIYFAGSAVDEFEFSNGYVPKFLGQLNWKEYADFLSDVDVTLCLIYTPHPSYPNLDTLASGGVAVTNVFANKNKSDCSDNFILSPLSVEGLAEGLKQGIQLSLNRKQRGQNYRNQQIPNNWEKTLEKSLEYMKQNLPYCMVGNFNEKE